MKTETASSTEPKVVVRAYYMISGLYSLSASLIWGVNTLFLLNAGLNIFEVFIANAVFTGSMALFEIPTGVLADSRGRRHSFLLSVVVLMVGTLGYVGTAAAGGGLLMFSLMGVVLGLGYTFYSGAVEAWLVDALAATGYVGEKDRVFARGSMVWSAAMLVGTIGGGLLGTLDLALPFVVRAGLLVGVFVVAWFTMHDLGFEPRAVSTSELPAEMRRIARSSVQYGWRKRSVRLLIGASAFHSLFMAWGFWAWQPYFLDLLGRNAPWITGVIAALIALSTIAGNSLVEFATRVCGKRTTLMLWASIVLSVAVIGVGLANSFWAAVGLYLLSMGAAGVYGPVRQAYLHQVIPSEQRATVISFDSLIGSGSSTMGQTGLGYLARAQSIEFGYVFGGLTTVLALPVVWLLRSMNEDADRIVGAAGKQGPCAPAGLPEVTTVDPAARTA